MKPEGKRTATERRRSNDEDGGAFNLAKMKHAIDAIDSAKDKKTFNLSSLAVALSVASRQMKRTEMISVARVNFEKSRKAIKKSEADNFEKTKMNKKTARRLRKKVMIGMKPDTNLELQRWFSNFDESFRRSLFQDWHKATAYQVPSPKSKEETQQHLCGFNTDCSDAFF